MSSLTAIMALSAFACLAMALSKNGFDEEAAMGVELLQTHGAEGLSATGESLIDGSSQAAVSALFGELDKDRDGMLGVSDWLERAAPNDPEGRQRLTELFATADTNLDGAIDIHEVQSVLPALLQQGSTSERIDEEAEDNQEFFEGLDENGNGKVELREWLHGKGADPKSQTPEVQEARKRLERAFILADTSGDGAISMVELPELLRRHEVEQERVDSQAATLSSMDLNKDGKIGQDEWNKQGQSDEQRVFAYADNNMDGKIDANEVGNLDDTVSVDRAIADPGFPNTVNQINFELPAVPERDLDALPPALE